MTPLELAKEVLEEVNALAPPAVNSIEIFPAHAKILAQEVLRLTEWAARLEKAHQRYWELQKDKEDIQRDRARQSEALREAAGIIKASEWDIGPRAGEWLAKHGEK